MNARRTLVSIITAAFIAISVFVFFTAFKIKEIDATYTTVEASSRVSSVKETLNEKVGENLLFVKTEDIKAEIECDPYFKVTEIKKSFPNVIEISVKERREIFYVLSSEKFFIVSEDGVVLRSSEEKPSGLIEITLSSGLEFNSIEIGSELTANETDRLKSAIKLTESVRLNDCVQALNVSKSDAGGAIGIFQTDVTYGLVTGGCIEILNIENYGVEKATYAMQAFDEEESDYVKSFGKIQAGDLIDGDYYVVWVS